MEVAALITMIAALTTLIALIMDKMRKSRCTKIESCCGFFRIERDIDSSENVEKSEGQ